MIALLLSVMIGLSPLACRPATNSPTQPDLPQREKPNINIPPEISKTVEPERDPALRPPQEPVARLLPESRIGVPEKDFPSRRVDYSTMISSRVPDPRHKSVWQYRITRQGQIVGFEFSNHGGNRILPPRRDAAKNQFYTRDFQFRFDERARQDIHLMVSDWAPSRDRVFRLSDIVNSLILFFPRTWLPAIVNFGERDIVTLPTGEEVEFDSATHEIRGGVFGEAPVDLAPDRALRNFPMVEYRGAGVSVRVNARGSDPRIATMATISTGAALPDCDKGLACNQCQVPSKELWEQGGAARFKFATDVEFERFILARCGFGLPKLSADRAVRTAVQ